MQITYAISLWNYIHYANQPSLERIIADVRHEGYGIELWGNCWNEPDLYDEIGRQRLKPPLEGMSISLHSAGFRPLDDLQQKQIDAAACWGAGVVVLHPEDLAAPQTTTDWAFARRLVDYARERGVKLALENGGLEFLTEAFTQVPGLYCCLDVGHVYLQYWATPPAQCTMRHFLDACKHRLIHLHLQDLCAPRMRSLRSAWDDHYTSGTGGIPAEDWQLLWATLEDIDFHGTAVFEIHPPSPLETAFQARESLDCMLLHPQPGTAR